MNAWTDAAKSHAVAEVMVCSKSLARRRLRLSQAIVRSTTHLRGNSVRSLDDRDRPFSQRPQRILEFLARIAAVGENMSQPREALDDAA